jgi:hypothetical protein
MHNVIFNGGSKSAAVWVGYYKAEDFNLFIPDAIDKVAELSIYACIDADYARTEATKYAKERHPWYFT